MVVVVAIVDFVFVVVVVPNVDVVVYATSKVDLRLLVKEFGWWRWWGRGSSRCAKSFSCQTQFS